MVVGRFEGALPEAARSDRIFHALADATRRDIVISAMAQERSVSALARRYPMSFAAVQKHVAVLERAGLVGKQRHGREQRVHGNIDAIREAFAVLEQLEAVWRARVGRFGDVLAELTASEPIPSDSAEGDTT